MYRAKAAACVSQGIKIKGEIAGTEDLFIDGTIEGKITLGEFGELRWGRTARSRLTSPREKLCLRGRGGRQVYGRRSEFRSGSTARVQGELKSRENIH